MTVFLEYLKDMFTLRQSEYSQLHIMFISV